MIVRRDHLGNCLERQWPGRLHFDGATGGHDPFHDFPCPLLCAAYLGVAVKPPHFGFQFPATFLPVVQRTNRTRLLPLGPQLPSRVDRFVEEPLCTPESLELPGDSVG